ncbi:cell division cycle- protein [Coemansia javaensis]|uniref:Cell division cycle- protein n=1 Tax=Coemansia javaensis TaxID=2761396 RepID=A0A9W8LJ66_9FUNG|nr:cell division cycle- protein [Coemansia javaensis]
MDGASSDDDDGLFLVPAALQSGQTTPSRASLRSEERLVWRDAAELGGGGGGGGDASHSQAPDGGGPGVRLQAFPRPRSSTEEPAAAAALDPRAERRRRNQYKRHGSLTLAQQQQEHQARLSADAGSAAFAGGRGRCGTLPPYIGAQQQQQQQQQPGSGWEGRALAQTALAAMAGSRLAQRLRSSSLASMHHHQSRRRDDPSGSGGKRSSSSSLLAPANGSQPASGARHSSGGSSAPRPAAAAAAAEVLDEDGRRLIHHHHCQQRACSRSISPAHAAWHGGSSSSSSSSIGTSTSGSELGVARQQQQQQQPSAAAGDRVPLREERATAGPAGRPAPPPASDAAAPVAEPSGGPEHARHGPPARPPPTNPLPRLPSEMSVALSRQSEDAGPPCAAPIASTPPPSPSPSSSSEPLSDATTEPYVDDEGASDAAVCTLVALGARGSGSGSGSCDDGTCEADALAGSTGAEAPMQQHSENHHHGAHAKAEAAAAADRPASLHSSMFAGVAISASRTTSTLNDAIGAGCVPIPARSVSAPGHADGTRAGHLPSRMFALIPRPGRLFDAPIAECRASEEFAHEIGAMYRPSKADERDDGGSPASAFSQPGTPAHSLGPRSSAATTVASAATAASRAAAEASLCRNSLFPSVVKQQSRCLSVLLQHGPHGGIRRVGPLLITRERGGAAIRHLNPAFIDMMDVQPVDSETTAFLKRSNIRRRSFSMPPVDPSSDWLSAIAGGAGARRPAPQGPSSGPGMWWPLNDDNCSDEVIYEVHVAAPGGPDAGPLAGASGARDRAGGPPSHLERMASTSTLASSGARPGTAPRKGSVSSQLRMMVRTESSGSVGAPDGGQPFHHHHPPGLVQMASDASDASTISAYPGRQQQSQQQQQLAPSHQLADVTMKTESGTITRSLKSISLRLLVNRLASPEGNADSDLLTDFLSAYRFFAHPIDVMRLVIVRYLNCFAAGADDPAADGADSGNDNDDGTDEGGSGDDDDDDDDDDDRYLTINGWRSNRPPARGDGDEPPRRPPSSSLPPPRGLPPLARNDGAIIQLRVMNIIKYWIKFHPHDFRLHHRLTRLLLLFLSHIQKQPGRADFVHAIRQKLSAGKLLAVEMPSARSSALRAAPPLDSTRSAIDLHAAGHAASPAAAAGHAHHHHLEGHARQPWPAPGGAAGGLSSSASAGSLQALHARPGAPRRQMSEAGFDSAGTAHAPSSLRAQHAKKGSTSYLRSLFHHRSNRASSSSRDAGADASAPDGAASASASASAPASASASALPPAVDGGHGASTPTGDMYATDFGSQVMEALAKSGVPTPQTPVERTLLNYSIAKRNLYRINLVGVDPATFAEQLTLLEHELFARISATEFSLKGRVGNLETILHTMQGAASDARAAAAAQAAAGGQQQHQQHQQNQQHHPGLAGPSNPVPNLTAMTSWFNQATYWAVLAVLSEPTPTARALVIKQLIHIAFHCLARRNYYGSFELAIALDNSAVRRLHDSWLLVPQLMKDIVAQMLQVLQSRMNFRTYRESVKAAMAGASGPDEEIFAMVSEQIRALRAKDLAATSQPGALMHSSLFGGGEEPRHHSRKKSTANGAAAAAAAAARDSSLPLLSEQDCACITYAIRIRAASFTFVDPGASYSGGAGGSAHAHTSVPASSSPRSTTRGSGSALPAPAGRQASDAGDSRSRRARSTSNGGGARAGAALKEGRMITDGLPLPLVPFVAVHMTDLLHADEANSTYSAEHQKMRSRNPTGPDVDARADADGQSRRPPRCDSAAISNVNQAQPLLNMQKFRLVTAMFRELHLAQRTKYPYLSDKALQQQIHSAVRNIKAQAGDIFAVVEDVALVDPTLARPPTAYSAPYGRSRTGSSASRTAGGDSDAGDHPSFGYPLYQIAALQKGQDGQALLDASMEWDGAGIKDNQELEQRLYMLSKWVEPSTR